MKIAIVDDKKMEAEMLVDICRAFAADNQLVSDFYYFESSQEFLDSFERSLYHIIFLDIYMEEMRGMEVAKLVRQEDSSGLLVVLTASSEHMSEAFSFHAFEYVVKPVTKERIYQVLTDALELLPPTEQYISFVSKRQNVQLPVQEFLYAVSSGHYVDISSEKNGSYRSRMNFYDFMKLLEGDERFLEINRGIVVNLDHVETVDESRCIMKNGGSFPVKVRERTMIRQQWQKYQMDQRRGS